MPGLIAIPSIFCWLLLRRGYPNSIRASGFDYALDNLAFASVHHLAR